MISGLTLPSELTKIIRTGKVVSDVETNDKYGRQKQRNTQEGSGERGSSTTSTTNEEGSVSQGGTLQEPAGRSPEETRKLTIQCQKRKGHLNTKKVKLSDKLRSKA